MMKMCMCCGRTRPLSEFYPHRRWCKPCLIEAQRNKRKSEYAATAEVSELLQRWGRV